MSLWWRQKLTKRSTLKITWSLLTTPGIFFPRYIVLFTVFKIYFRMRLTRMKLEAEHISLDLQTRFEDKKKKVSEVFNFIISKQNLIWISTGGKHFTVFSNLQKVF